MVSYIESDRIREGETTKSSHLDNSPTILKACHHCPKQIIECPGALLAPYYSMDLFALPYYYKEIVGPIL